MRRNNLTIPEYGLEYGMKQNQVIILVVMGLILVALVAFTASTGTRGPTNADLGIKDPNHFHDGVERYLDSQMPAGQHL